jgi:hypothetical protein
MRRMQNRWYWLASSLIGACGAASCSDADHATFGETGGVVGTAAGGAAAGTEMSGGMADSARAGSAGRPMSSGGEPLASAGAESDGGHSTGGVAAGGIPAGGVGAGGEADADAGQAGVGGEAPAAPAGEACVACGANQCGALVDGCGKNSECAPWLSCLKACDSNTCARACDADYADVARVYYGIYACLCSSCSAACSVADSCSQRCGADALPPSSVEPATLAETGLYSMSGSAPELAAYVRLYVPRYPLWADGAGKDRYIYIPACATIDTKDMDHWQFPVGTRLWKHFSVGDKLVETRMIHRYGSGAGDWLFATYGWDTSKPNDPSAAAAVLHGLPNAGGTLHDIPDPSACTACHGKLPDKPLGFGAVQLSHDGAGLTMQKLSDWGWLSVPARAGFEIPGTPVQQAALGYLHANCGGCHNSYGEIPRENPMKLRLLVGQTNYAQTDTVLTTIGVPTINAYPELHDKPRIDPGAPSNSAIYLRMSDRNKFPMPPLATKFADTEGGVAAVSAWINSIPKN